MGETVIQVRDVSMHFNLMEEKVDSIKEYIVKLVKGKLLYNDFTQYWSEFTGPLYWVKASTYFD